MLKALLNSPFGEHQCSGPAQISICSTAMLRPCLTLHLWNINAQALLNSQFVEHQRLGPAQLCICATAIPRPCLTRGAVHPHFFAPHPPPYVTCALRGSQASTNTSMSTTAPAKKHKMMTDFFNSSKEMDEQVSRMAALDGLPFSKFYTSEDLRDLFHRCGYKLPESGTAIKRIVPNL
ncbi:hypothetical protein ACJJTC_017181 [Scirpophaga incertulas]